jgi:hypothetical protein
MGWLEVLAMLKRLLPLLTRVAPLLESYVGGRIAGRDEAAAIERVAADLKHDLIATTAAHRTETEAALAEQTALLRELTEEVRWLHAAEEARAAQLATVQERLGSLQTTMRLLAIGIVLILILATVAILRR